MLSSLGRPTLPCCRGRPPQGHRTSAPVHTTSVSVSHVTMADCVNSCHVSSLCVSVVSATPGRHVRQVSHVTWSSFSLVPVRNGPCHMVLFLLGLCQEWTMSHGPLSPWSLSGRDHVTWSSFSLVSVRKGPCHMVLFLLGLCQEGTMSHGPLSSWSLSGRDHVTWSVLFCERSPTVMVLCYYVPCDPLILPPIYNHVPLSPT